MVGKSVRETVATQSASNPYQVNSLALGADTNPIAGVVKWDPVRSLWNGTNFVAAIALAPIYATWDAIAVFLVISALTLCTGHSVGYHRRLVHRSFKCAKWLERLLVWMGAAVGMGGPLWTIRTHDTRDWAQRQPRCHDFLAHRHGLLKDGWWNLHCRLVLDNPPRFDPGPGIADDRSTNSSNILGCGINFLLAWFFSPWVDGLGSCGASSYGLQPAQQCTGSFHTLHIQEVRRAGPLMAQECRRMMFLSPQFPRWVKAGTTITTPFRRRRATAFIRASQTLGFASFN